MEHNTKKEYFNKPKFMKAISLIEDRPYDALCSLKEYILEYPEDYSAYPYYISTLITFGCIEEAVRIMDEVKMLAY